MISLDNSIAYMHNDRKIYVNALTSFPDDKSRTNKMNWVRFQIITILFTNVYLSFYIMMIEDIKSNIMKL